MKSTGLIEQPPGDNGAFHITVFGVKVHESGGWLKHLERITAAEKKDEDDRQLQRDLAKSNIEANEINKINANRNRWILIGGLFLTLIGAVLSILNYIWIVRN